jgi:hypothetical protein
MRTHRFSVGQTVRLLRSVVNRNKSISCEILQIMPVEGLSYQYRVRGEHERFERIAQEHELTEIIASHAETAQVDLAEKLPSPLKQAMKG